MNTPRRPHGFTTVEIVFVVLVLAAASVIFFMQRNELAVSSRDEMRKTAINAMHYSLEEVYYPQNNAYPRTINATTLPSVDPALFNDPNGVALGEADGDYRYEGYNCTGDSCAQYSLRTTLESEGDFVKENRNR